jgi:hypothetical protein
VQSAVPPKHEHVIEDVQQRLDADPQAMRRRRVTVEHPFFTRTPPKVATEMALALLAYNLTRAMNILGVGPLIAAMRA